MHWELTYPFDLMCICYGVVHSFIHPGTCIQTRLRMQSPDFNLLKTDDVTPMSNKQMPIYVESGIKTDLS